MNNFIKSFSNKKVRYGSFSTLSIIVVIAILIVINLIFGQLNLSTDLTSDKIYSITDATKDALRDVDKKVTIYPLFQTGETSYFIDIYKELLEEYPSANRNISLEYMDPYLYPQFVQNYTKEGETISAGSIIVVSGEKFKVIPQSDLLTLGYDSSTYTQYVQSMNIEREVTNAVRYVVSDYANTIYYVSNHSEAPLTSGVLSQLAYANFEVKDIDLMTAESIPEDCNLLLATTPAKDWSADEADLVRSYLQEDGYAAFFIDMTSYDLTNLIGVLETYGVTFKNNVIIEGSYNNMYRGNPIYLVPNYNSHSITDNLIEKSYSSVIAMAMPIESLSLKKNSTKIEPLMVSSADSYTKDISSQTVSKEANDETGPFNMAVAITDSFYTNAQHESKLIVMGTSSVIAAELDSYAGGNNINFFINALKWTQNETQDIYIRPKTTSSSYSIEMSWGQAITIMVISVIVIPVIIIIAGVVIWLRRRNS